MFSPKDYLLVEWANVRRNLQETLRFRYSESHIRDFYAECEERLDYIKKNLDATSTKETSDLREIALSLDNLAHLIARVERSHLEEFSWPFGDALAHVAKHICTEQLALQREPLFFFAAEGGINSYAIRPEKQGPSAVDQKIFSVIFPRSLKDHVLLHAILAHEVGHAAYATDSILHDLQRICETLIAGSPVATPNGMFAWCKNNIGVVNKGSSGVVAERHASWTEEFYCDLFGLILCGPSYLCAFQSMLEPMALPKGTASQFVPSHPPFECRMIALVEAATELGFFYSRDRKDKESLARTFDAALIDKASNLRAAGHSLLISRNVRKATRELMALMGRFDDLVFPPLDFELIQKLDRALERNIPPTEGIVAGGKRIRQWEDRVPDRIDFRHILYAGWVHWSNKRKLPIYKEVDSMEKLFSTINRLCSHAILQQQSIGWWIHNLSRKSHDGSVEKGNPR